MSEEIIENPAVASAEEIEEQVIVKPAKKSEIVAKIIDILG